MPTPIKVPATVRAVLAHGEDVFSVCLTPMRDVPSYQPGQFLHLALEAYDPSQHWPESRAFSIATSPTRASELRITFAVKGGFTRRMASSLRPGTVVWLKLPYGDFVLPTQGTGEVVLIAGGTGMTPFVAFLEFLLDRPVARPVKLFYGARREDLLLYRELIQECVERLPGFLVRYFVEVPSGHPNGHVYRPGRLSIEEIMRSVSRPLQAQYYLSGPPAMIAAFSAQLAARGVQPPHIHTDAWE